MNSIRLTTNKNFYFKGPIIIEDNVFTDSRGFFFESWNEKDFCEIIDKKISFVQDNFSFSKKGVLRGLHFQINPFAQGKLIRCVNGSIFDVIVDLRKNSPTFKQWAGIKLTDNNYQKLWVPEGFAHGFLTLSETAKVFYKVTEYWEKNHELTLKWNDPQLAIDWGNTSDIKLSEKDYNGTLFKDLKNHLFI